MSSMRRANALLFYAFFRSLSRTTRIQTPIRDRYFILFHIHLSIFPSQVSKIYPRNGVLTHRIYNRCDIKNDKIKLNRV